MIKLSIVTLFVGLVLFTGSVLVQIESLILGMLELLFLLGLTELGDNHLRQVPDILVGNECTEVIHRLFVARRLVINGQSHILQDRVLASYTFEGILEVIRRQCEAGAKGLDSIHQA